MKKSGWITTGLAAGMATATAWATSLEATPAPQPIPERDTPAAAPLVANLSAGSAALVPLMAADMEARHTVSVDAEADRAGGAANTPVDDVAFVKRATESSRKEIASARDALPQLKKPELKRIAEMLVNDHGAANEKLSKLAESKGWPVPAPQPPAAPASGTASSDFDARWTAEMIAGHEKSVALYRAQATGGEDKDLREYARSTLPTIEHHLAELKGQQK